MISTLSFCILTDSFGDSWYYIDHAHNRQDSEAQFVDGEKVGGFFSPSF